MVDVNLMFPKLLRPIIDSIAKEELAIQIKLKLNAEGRHNDEQNTLGTTNYINGCLFLYKSNQLDSFLRTIPKNKYLLRLN